MLAALLVVSSLTLAGCSKDTAAAPTPTSTASPDVPASPGDDTTPAGAPTPQIKYGDNGQPDYCATQKTPFGGEPAKVYGAKNVMAAYCQMIDLWMSQSTVPTLLRKDGDFRAIEFSLPRRQMTPTMQAAWDKKVSKALKAHESGEYGDDYYALYRYMAFGMGVRDDAHQPKKSDLGLSPDPDVPVIADQRFSPGTASVAVDGEGTQRLQMEFTIEANMVAVDGTNKQFIYPITRDYTMWLVPVGSGDSAAWQIAGMEVSYEVASEPRRRTLS